MPLVADTKSDDWRGWAGPGGDIAHAVAGASEFPHTASSDRVIVLILNSREAE